MPCIVGFLYQLMIHKNKGWSLSVMNIVLSFASGIPYICNHSFLTVGCNMSQSTYVNIFEGTCVTYIYIYISYGHCEGLSKLVIILLGDPIPRTALDPRRSAARSTRTQRANHG